MPSPNVETVRRIHEGFNRREIDPLYELFDPEVEWHQDPGAVEPGSYYGHEGLTRWVESLFEGFEQFEIEPERYIEAGDRVLSLYRIRARGKGSGMEIDGRSASLWRFRGGKVVEQRAFLDQEQALAALSASEGAGPSQVP